MNTHPTSVAASDVVRLERSASRWRWIVAALLVGGGLVLAACSPSVTPRVIGFQGRLNDSGGSPISGSKPMTFTLWTASSGGTVVFTETQTVAVTNGLFNAFIGQSTLPVEGQYDRSGIDPEKFAVPLFVQVEVDGETLTPRTRLGSAATSMGLVGGAVVVSDHDGNGSAGAGDSTNSNYASLSVIASSTVSGTALIVGHALGNTGDFIKICGNITTSTRSCPDPKFRFRANGDATADGSFTGGGADYAEYFASKGDVSAGDVLAIGPNGNLVLSSKANQNTVVGVYSTDPGFLANGAHQGEAGYVPVALMGVVPVKVTGVVSAGDMLVASNVPGRAMRSKNPAAGTVIGKALESSKGGSNVILMLVMVR